MVKDQAKDNSRYRIIKIEKDKMRNICFSLYLIGVEWLRGERVEDGNGEDDLKLKLGEKYLICNLTSHW